MATSNRSGPNTSANPTQGTNPQEPTRVSAVDANQPAERDLHIVIYRDEFVGYTGTRAQPIAEGLIPKGFEWPRAAEDESWEACGNEFSLWRTRPEGHKGPMRSRLELDHWSLQIRVARVAGCNPGWRVQRQSARQAGALQLAY